MSREIKFRVWCIREGYFIGPDTYLAYQQGLELKGGLINNFKRTNIHDCFIKDFALLQETYYVPEQYVGLKDMNGKELYEGDIVRWGITENTQTRYIVSFGEYLDIEGESHIGFFLNSKNSCNNSILKMSPIEIIGNIHENPELLKN